jgi:hypothetical protein
MEYTPHHGNALYYIQLAIQEAEKTGDDEFANDVAGGLRDQLSDAQAIADTRPDPESIEPAYDEAAFQLRRERDLQQRAARAREVR